MVEVVVDEGRVVVVVGWRCRLVVLVVVEPDAPFLVVVLVAEEVVVDVGLRVVVVRATVVVVRATVVDVEGTGRRVVVVVDGGDVVRVKLPDELGRGRAMEGALL